jgi:olefin beta-lactone synthetase
MAPQQDFQETTPVNHLNITFCMGEPFNISSLFFKASAKYPSNTAIISKEVKLSYKDFEKSIHETSQHFLSKGIAKGDRVLIFVPMGIDLYRIVLALFNIGATAVFLDEWVGKKRLEECCKVAQCKAFIGIWKAHILSIFSTDLRRIPIKLGLKYTTPKTKYRVEPTFSDDTALITFTTGSTGVPKAAKRTHGFLLEQFKALTEKIKPCPEDIDMPVLPIVLLMNLGAGCTSVIADFKASKPNSLKPESIARQISSYGVNRIIASPFFVKELAKHLIHSGKSLDSVKEIYTGGAPVFPNEAGLYHQAFPDAKVEVVYGSTEAEPISAIEAKDLLEKKETLVNTGLNVGFPHRVAQVKIIAMQEGPITCNNFQDLQAMELKAMELGEIIVSGPHVLKEYFNNEEALKANKIFVEGQCWHRTGDSGYLGENGCLYLTGRCNTIFYEREKPVAPFIYENYLQAIPGVEIGTILKTTAGIVAAIEVGKTADKTSIQHQVKALGLEFKEIRFLKKIPRDPRHNSKIEYQKLKTMIS